MSYWARIGVSHAGEEHRRADTQSFTCCYSKIRQARYHKQTTGSLKSVEGQVTSFRVTHRLVSLTVNSQDQVIGGSPGLARGHDL